MSDDNIFTPKENDFSLPKHGSDLSDWHWFCSNTIEVNSDACIYLEELMRLHGSDYVVETDSLIFLDHIARVAFTRDHYKRR
jgi:hypothetical protein